MTAAPQPVRWNPRYVAWAQAQGHTPEQQHAIDKAKVSCMMDFSLWIQARWAEYHQLRGWPRDYPLSDADHAAFDAWLWTTV